MRKAEIGVQAIFYVLMGIIFVSILVFGFNKLFLVQDQLDKQELIEIKNKLEADFTYCDDPLNKGNFKQIEFNTKHFNTICILEEDIKDSSSNFNSIQEFKTIYESGENVVLLKANTISNSGSTNLKDVNVIDSFKAEIDYDKTTCFTYDNIKNKLQIKISC